MPLQISTGNAIAMLFLRKIRPNDSATTQPTSRRLRLAGAASRLEPQPKFSPATITSPGWNPAVNPGWMCRIAFFTSSHGWFFTNPGAM